MSEFISKYLTKHMSKYKGDFSIDYFNKLADCEAKAIKLYQKNVLTKKKHCI